MRFKPGHVLYRIAPDLSAQGRRRRLRWRISANTTYRPRAEGPEVLLPELLPFIMQTESFHEHSVEQSKGSLNRL